MVAIAASTSCLSALGPEGEQDEGASHDLPAIGEEAPASGGGGLGAEATGATGGAPASHRSAEVHACESHSDCPAPAIGHVVATTKVDWCFTHGVSAGTPSPSQIQGDCKTIICIGIGIWTEIEDELDVPDDGKECTVDRCEAGIGIHLPIPAGSPCPSTSGMFCDAAGACVGCADPVYGALCYPYACGTLTCNTTCDDDGDCASTAYCEDGECIEKKWSADPCGGNNECATGHCVDGVCCDSACGAGAPGDCQACNVPGREGVCSPLPQSTVCRAAVGDCDAAETCTGVSAACPPDRVAPAGVTCRCMEGPCDTEEYCDGVGKSCPPDAVASSMTVCRPSAGECDVAEMCDGSRKTCPANAFVPSRTVCRVASGLCDAAETCTGTSATCPPDRVVPAGVTCRCMEGPCDAEEQCNGISKSCPADGVAPSSAVCRPAANLCDAEERCSGSSKSCPADAVKRSGVVCRPASGACDIAEVCSGSSKRCPADAVEPSGAVCFPAAGNEDAAGVCDGTAKGCSFEDDGETDDLPDCDGSGDCYPGDDGSDVDDDTYEPCRPEDGC
ncbi:hypothetical protein [Sorangium sp. So ce341]|uniref:hypothetical protein n=1 Tax=Sorangium sp. So ce341 TaxID=3133302 RepID=UPI003F63A95F